MEILTDTDIDSYIDNKKEEDRCLEFKAAIDLSDDKNQIELCRDIVAFANTEGGRIIYGLSENEGVATSIKGIEGNIDNFKQIIQQILLSKVEPNLSACNIYTVKCSEKYGKKNCIVIDINKSWNAPHAVKIHDKYQFPFRTDSGKNYYDMHRLKEEVMKYSTLEYKIKSFVEKRIHFIKFGEGEDLEICTEPYLIVHCIPISSFADELKINTDTFCGEMFPKIPLLGSHVSDFIPNLEGILVYSGKDENSYLSCSQLFRNGCIESRRRLNKEKSLIYFKDIEDHIKMFYNGFGSLYKEINVNTPIFLFVNFINIKDYCLVEPNNDLNKKSNPIKRSRLILPSLEIKDFDDDFKSKFKNIFNILFNAFGKIRPNN